MVKIQPNKNTYRGGKIVSITEIQADVEYDVLLHDNNTASGVLATAAELVVGDWCVFIENEGSQYGKTPVWEVITFEFCDKWLRVIGG